MRVCVYCEHFSANIQERQIQLYNRRNSTKEEVSMAKTLTKIIKNAGGVSIAYW